MHYFVCGEARKIFREEEEEEDKPKLPKVVADTLDIYNKKKEISVTMDSEKYISLFVFLCFYPLRDTLIKIKSLQHFFCERIIIDMTNCVYA
jgi:hypothetical protein